MAHFITSRRLMLASTLAALGLVAACSSSSDSSSTTSIDVVPSKGRFSDGANVKAYNPLTGAELGSGTTSSGSARLNLGAYSGPFVLKVVGGTGVTFYNEANGASVAFSASDSMLSVIPAVTANASYGVTPLTNMAAKIAGVASDLTISGASASAIADSVKTAIATTQLAIGVSSSDFNITSAPVALSASSLITSSSSASAAKYALVLASLATAYGASAKDMIDQLANAGSAYKTTPASGITLPATLTSSGSVFVGGKIAIPASVTTAALASGVSAPTITISTPKLTQADIAAAVAAEIVKVEASLPTASSSASGSGSGSGSGSSGLSGTSSI